MSDSWVEPRSRVPLAGIIGIVIVVAVVSLFLKTHMDTLFPGSQFVVEPELARDGTSNTIGKAGQSFQGIREFPLSSSEVLRGTLQKSEDTFTFTVDVQEQHMIITKNGLHREEILLERTGDSLTAEFEYDNEETRVDVYPKRNSLQYSKPGVSNQPIDVAVAMVPIYRGRFLYEGIWYVLEFLQQSDTALITGEQAYIVALSEQQPGEFSGTWREDGSSHPVKISLQSPASATVEDLW